MKHLSSFFVLCLFLQTLLTSCGEDDGVTTNAFIGQWRITSARLSNALEQFAPDEETIRWVFETNENYSGNTTVNQFSGRYRLDGSNTLTLLEFQTTEVADTQFATAFYAAISEAIVPETTFAQLGYSFTGNTLTLTFGDGGRLVLERL